MRERDFLKVSSYPRRINKEWQKQIKEYIEQHGVRQLPTSNNYNPNFNVNGDVYIFGKRSK